MWGPYSTRPGGEAVEVALSEHEERLLEELEQALNEDDPTFADRLRLKNAWFDARRGILWPLVGLGLGIALLLLFCLTTVVLVGVAGFLVMAVSLDGAWPVMRTMVLAMSERGRSKRTTLPGR